MPTDYLSKRSNDPRGIYVGGLGDALSALGCGRWMVFLDLNWGRVGDEGESVTVMDVDSGISFTETFRSEWRDDGDLARMVLEVFRPWVLGVKVMQTLAQGENNE